MRISVTGFAKERFLNLLSANDIFAWDIVNTGGKLMLSVSISGLRKLRPILRKTHCRFRIISKHGLPYFIYRHKKRTVFVFGAFMFLVLVFAMSQFIWLIEINGNFFLTDTELIQFCKNNGVYTGMYKHNIDTDILKTKIRQNYPQISWISIVQNGTRLLIEISENSGDTVIAGDAGPLDVISARDCIVTKIIAQNGTPAVNVGDTVKKGDVLIRSVFDTLDENGQPAPLSPARSSGIVRGKWRCRVCADIPYKANIKAFTGKRDVFLSLELFGIDFNTNFIKNDTKFKNYDIIKRNIQLCIGADYPLPAVIKKTVYAEYVPKQVVYTEEKARQAAETALNKKLFAVLPQSCDILDKKVDFTYSGELVTAAAELLLEDDIGVNTGGIAINGTNEASDRQ